MDTDAFTIDDWAELMRFVGCFETHQIDKVVRLARFIEVQRIDGRHNGHDVGISDSQCIACQPVGV
jgi:hypothetical protein